MVSSNKYLNNIFDNNIKLNKYTVRSNVNINLTKTTELAVRISGTFDSYQGPLSGGSAIYSQAIKASPVEFPLCMLLMKRILTPNMYYSVTQEAVQTI